MKKSYFTDDKMLNFPEEKMKKNRVKNKVEIADKKEYFRFSSSPKR